MGFQYFVVKAPNLVVKYVNGIDAVSDYWNVDNVLGSPVINGFAHFLPLEGNDFPSRSPECPMEHQNPYPNPGQYLKALC